MTGLRKTALATGILMVTALPVSADPRQFSCTGSMIEPTGSAPSPKTVRLSIKAGGGVGVDLGEGSADARVVSNNSIQLKFETKDFIGEFFHYTGDLFLIYPSGHLARLTCSPN